MSCDGNNRIDGSIARFSAIDCGLFGFVLMIELDIWTEERLSKKQKKLNRKLQMALSHNGQCSYEKMNCFSHDNDHWRTAPLWNDGIPFLIINLFHFLIHPRFNPSFPPPLPQITISRAFPTYSFSIELKMISDWIQLLDP